MAGVEYGPVGEHYAAVGRIDGIADMQVVPSGTGGVQASITDIQGTAHAGLPWTQTAGPSGTVGGVVLFYDLTFHRMSLPDVDSPQYQYDADPSEPAKDGAVWVYRVMNPTGTLPWGVGLIGSSRAAGEEPLDDGDSENLLLPGQPVILPAECNRPQPASKPQPPNYAQ